MKLKCLVVDDEPLAIDVLKNYIFRLDDLFFAGKCRTATEAFSFLSQKSADLVLLDIQMPGLDGLQLIRSLEKPPMVIFTTASREFAVQSYELNAVDYLVKPVSFERFLTAINKAMSRFQEKSLPEKQQQPFYVKSESKTYKVDTSQIDFIESVRDHVVVHLTDGEEITSYISLTAIADQLPGNKFLRIHRSYLVGVQNIRAFSNAYVETVRKTLPIGRTYKDEVMQKMH